MLGRNCVALELADSTRERRRAVDRRSACLFHPVQYSCIQMHDMPGHLAAWPPPFLPTRRLLLRTFCIGATPFPKKGPRPKIRISKARSICVFSFSSIQETGNASRFKTFFSETMGLSEGIINSSQQSPHHLTRSRVENILGSSTDEKIDKLLIALEVESQIYADRLVSGTVL